uniref:Uncharacterized protein n=1 Tax=Lates calcarifer TaxID=8187 RepID=A0A4W6E9M7_LATCA
LTHFLSVQVDEYKQLKESLNRMPNLRQPEQNPQATILEQPHKDVPPHEDHQVERVKSAYEQQQEQQRLEAQRAEERRQIQMRQEALQAQRERVLKEREQRLKEEQEREQQQHREADRREQQLREEHQRKKTEYENMDNDIVQGEEDGHIDDEEGETERLPPRRQECLNLCVLRVCVQMAGNPDQQEDTLDDQYQEEGEDEAQEDIAAGQKREDEVEEEGEDPYNEDNIEQVAFYPRIFNSEMQHFIPTSQTGNDVIIKNVPLRYTGGAKEIHYLSGSDEIPSFAVPSIFL